MWNQQKKFNVPNKNNDVVTVDKESYKDWNTRNDIKMYKLYLLTILLTS